MEKKYKFFASILVVLVILSSSILIGLYSKNNKEEKIIVNFFEKDVSEQELLDMSDMVVRGKITEKIEEIDYKSESIEAVLSLYKFEVTEEYYYTDEESGQDEIIVSYAGTELPEEIIMNEEYVLYLTRNTLNYGDDDIFSFVSLSQGIYKNEGQWKNEKGTVLDIELIRSKHE